jgi:hypothetical protein
VLSSAAVLVVVTARAKFELSNVKIPLTEMTLVERPLVKTLAVVAGRKIGARRKAIPGSGTPE